MATESLHMPGLWIILVTTATLKGRHCYYPHFIGRDYYPFSVSWGLEKQVIAHHLDQMQSKLQMGITTSWISVVFKSCPSISLKLLLKLSSISPMDMWDLAGGERRAERSVPGSPCRDWTSADIGTPSWLQLNAGPASLVAVLWSPHSLSRKPEITQSLACLNYSPFSADLSRKTLPKISSKGKPNPALGCQYFVFFLCCIILLPWPGSSLLLLMWWPNDLSIHSLRHSLWLNFIFQGGSCQAERWAGFLNACLFNVWKEAQPHSH